MNMKFRNIFWWVNGVLFDTYPALTYSFSKALNVMGFSIALNVIDGLVRQSLDDCVNTLADRFRLDPGLLRQKFAVSYRNISPASQMPFPGVRELCESIQRNGGSNLAVTDTDLESTRRLFETHRFTGLIGDTLILNKADAEQSYPALLRAALDKHSLSPTETLLIGAQSFHIQAGRLADICTCLVGKPETTAGADIQVEKVVGLGAVTLTRFGLQPFVPAAEDGLTD